MLFPHLLDPSAGNTNTNFDKLVNMNPQSIDIANRVTKDHLDEEGTKNAMLRL